MRGILSKLGDNLRPWHSIHNTWGGSRTPPICGQRQRRMRHGPINSIGDRGGIASPGHVLIGRGQRLWGHGTPVASKQRWKPTWPFTPLSPSTTSCTPEAGGTLVLRRAWKLCLICPLVTRSPIGVRPGHKHYVHHNQVGLRYPSRPDRS
jgi:hypothetical protein